MTALVLLPGINNTAGTWQQVREGLPSSLGTTALDLPAIENVDGLAAELVGDLPERFVAVGHSFGGYVALALLANYPERVTGLVLVNSGTGADRETVASGRLEKAEQARAGGYQELAEAASGRAYHPDHTDDQAMMAAREEQIHAYGAERYAAHQTAASTRPDRTELLTSAKIPKLFVVADHDQVVPTERQQALAPQVGADATTVGPAGHMLPAEQPGRLAAALADWIADHATELDNHPSPLEHR